MSRKQSRTAETADRTRAMMTLMRPGAPVSTGQRISAFPEDLFEQARGRLRLLAGFFFVAFLFDVVAFVGAAAYLRSLPRDAIRAVPVQSVSLAAAVVSAIVWWAAKNPKFSAARIHTTGLIYEVLLCAIVATISFWQYYHSTGLIQNLTWVPAIVIMFPLIMPGPPRRMLLAAIASGATSPLALVVLTVTGKAKVNGDGFISAVVSSSFAVVFAYLGARVIYRLGREVAIARALGSYQLEEKLGEGGMGEVWRATHRMLARPAAVKLIRPDLAGSTSAGVSEEARKRFEREARAIASLRSPHTVNLFDYGVSNDGAFYYAMELLDGLDADSLVRRFGPVPAERAVHLLRQVCHSLAEAEARGLVHRDIKPSNIFVCRYGEDHDFVKVLDFGIVKTRHDTAGEGSTLTRETVIHGTPAFMAPEQALGGNAIDGRADLYSLGCVAFWLLTGELVFTADTQSALLLQHIQTPPSAPSTRTELPVPGALDQIVLSCLAKNPADRPQSARDLSRRLDTVTGTGVWNEDRSREWWDRHRPASATV
ncbi:MAG TPA: serine/threonine-protein kinase [Candidatus Krumholzibacteria bacterium]|nr:serine/threonine-protein kinase [Candidatus Krumholzibacteria bacterium]